MTARRHPAGWCGRTALRLQMLACGSTAARLADTANCGPVQRVAIFEPADAWRHWLTQVLARLPACVTRAFGSAQALVTALHVEPVDLLLVPFRVRHLDGTGWLQSLRASPAGAQARLVAFVGSDDLRGVSLARMAGADQVFRKVVDARQVAAALHRAMGPELAPAVPRPAWQRPQDPPRVTPLFDSTALVGGEALPDALERRTRVFGFLMTMACHAEALDQLYNLPPAEAQHALEAFAEAASQVGAWRLAQHVDLMVTVLMLGGRLHPGLAGAFAALLADTERELAIWLLEGPTPMVDPMLRPGRAQ